MTYGNGQSPTGINPSDRSNTPHAPKILSDLERAINEMRAAQGQPPVGSTPSALHQTAHPRQVDPAFAQQAEALCKGVFRMLCEKNAAYGNSALDPIRIFSNADADEQIKVRIDDKLSRIKWGSEYPGDDTIIDTIGYLILLLIARQRQANPNGVQ